MGLSLTKILYTMALVSLMNLFSILMFQQDNAIAYWRKFVAEYFSPHAKKRWCLSFYENVGQNALGVFPEAAMVCSPVILICFSCLCAL